MLGVGNVVSFELAFFSCMIQARPSRARSSTSKHSSWPKLNEQRLLEHNGKTLKSILEDPGIPKYA